jgi:hypothetical protein
LFPSRLATPEVAMAGALREAFGTLADLDSVLVFIDEVEEVAGSAPVYQRIPRMA